MKPQISELMLRLILNDKIVGYEWHKDNKIYVTYTNHPLGKDPMRQYEWFNIQRHHIKYNSFELGVKVDENYLFEGDKGILFFAGKEKTVTLVFDGYQFAFATEGQGFYYFPEYNHDFKLLGTIHDEVIQ